MYSFQRRAVAESDYVPCAPALPALLHIAASIHARCTNQAPVAESQMRSLRRLGLRRNSFRLLRLRRAAHRWRTRRLQSRHEAGWFPLLQPIAAHEGLVVAFAQQPRWAVPWDDTHKQGLGCRHGTRCFEEYQKTAHSERLLAWRYSSLQRRLR